MTKEPHKKRIILADKVSGAEAVVFIVSAVAHVIELGNKRVKFKFPFWAFSIPAGSNHGTEWINNDSYQAVTDKILRLIIKPSGLDYFRNIERRIVKEEKYLEQYAQNLRGDLKNFSDQELVRQYEKFIEKYSYYYGLGIVTFLYEGILSEKLMKSLNIRYPNAAAFLPQLFKNSYKSFMLSSEQALLKIKNANVAARRKLIRKYIADFFYIRANYGQAPLVTEKFILESIVHLKKHRDEKIVRKEIRLKLREKRVIGLLKISEAIRDKRKQMNIIGSYMMFRFLEEASRRRQIVLKLATRAFWFEYRDLILKTAKILPILKKRQQTAIGYDGQKCFYLDYLALREKPNTLINKREISGTPAAPGIYQGKIHKIMTSKDFNSFKKGEILLATMTRPDFLPLMKKAGAIITDEGGLTCHAAIVSRELKVPCIVGTKIATQVLHDGDLVEVNATKGTVKIIKVK